MKKILVPTDFSKNSANALQVAAELALKSGASIELLHVNSEAVYTPVFSEYYAMQKLELDEYAKAITDDLHAAKTRLINEERYAKLPIETRMEEGFLHNTVKRIAEEDGCDLVVMGTKGATGAVEFFVGSNTEKVIRTTVCPLLVVPEVAQTSEIKRVIMPTTLKPDQLKAFETLASWQQLLGFEVIVLYLNNPGGFDSNAAMNEAARDFYAKSGLQKAELFTSSNTFNEEQAILQFADERDADLIAMATHQRKGISHMLFGSLTEDTANHAEIPVLCIPIQ